MCVCMYVCRCALITDQGSRLNNKLFTLSRCPKKNSATTRKGGEGGGAEGCCCTLSACMYSLCAAEALSSVHVHTYICVCVCALHWHRTVYVHVRLVKLDSFYVPIAFPSRSPKTSIASKGCRLVLENTCKFSNLNNSCNFYLMLIYLFICAV